MTGSRIADRLAAGEVTCLDCGETKPYPDDFYARSGEICRACRRVRIDTWKKENPERVREYGKKSARRWQGRNADYHHAYRLKKMYGLDWDDYQRMLADQGNKCFLCGEEENRERYGVRYRLVVDHNHATGEVRRLLCSACNLAIGMVETRIGLARVISYLGGVPG